MRLRYIDIEVAYARLKQLRSGSGLGWLVGGLGGNIDQAGCVVVRSSKLESHLRLVTDLCMLPAYHGFLVPDAGVE